MNSLTRTENQALARTVLELDVNNHPASCRTSSACFPAGHITSKASW